MVNFLLSIVRVHGGFLKFHLLLQVKMFYSTASLEDLCLIKIVQQLEHYPHELLACLPPTLRRLLLVHLPIVDVCKLENTCVFEEVDAEEIWEEHFELHIPMYFTSLDNFVPHDVQCAKKELDERQQLTWREKFFSIIVNIILGVHAPPATSLLLGIMVKCIVKSPLPKFLPLLLLIS